MPTPTPAHRDRTRASAFGLAALEYDRYRPRYPDSLVAELVTDGGMRVLDVGAGTGIASAQLIEAGADVLAIEPDPRMARAAVDKGIRVEHAGFEDWEPAGRTFALVVFAQSFHWVEPRTALAKIADLLMPGGHLALLSNRITPVRPMREQLDAAYTGILDISQRPAIDAVRDKKLGVIVAESGFTVEKRRVIEQLHFTTEEWVGLVGTYSSVLVLESQARAELQHRLTQSIGSGGVHAENDAVAVICTPAPR
jgi:SAM-dependent methyltransferase